VIRLILTPSESFVPGRWLHPAPRARQRSLQYFTCSQQAAHFFRH